MENFEQSEAHRVLAKAYSTIPVGEPSVHIKISREAFRDMQPLGVVKAVFNPSTEEVSVETKYQFKDTPTTMMLKVADMQDRAMLEALPDDVLKKLYMSIKFQMQSRGLPL